MNHYDIENAILDTTYEWTYTPYKATEPMTFTETLDWHDLWCGDLDYRTANEPIKVEGFGVLRVIETVGGEGEGDHAHVVVSLTDGLGQVRYFKKNGYHSSYVGTEFDGSFDEVTPVEKTITVYKTI